MEITEVRINPHEPRFPNDLLQAFCSVTFDNSFAVRDLKILGAEGKSLFVAMPQRLISSHCPRCGKKNCLEALYCNWCGVKFNQINNKGKTFKSHMDVAHPITGDFRHELEEVVLKSFKSCQHQ